MMLTTVQDIGTVDSCTLKLGTRGKHSQNSPRVVRRTEVYYPVFNVNENIYDLM